MTPDNRDRFDRLLDQALAGLPSRVRAVLDDLPLIVDDEPDPALRQELARTLDAHRHTEPEVLASTLCGLHSGIPLTQRSVEQSAVLPADIRIYRRGIVNAAGGWGPGSGESAQSIDHAIYREIVITLLHEIGHHFGLDEDDLDRLGYA